MSRSLPERVKKLEAQKAAIDLRLQRLAAYEKDRRRREDTRAKIILGAAVLAFLRRDPVAARAFQPRLLPLVAERDRSVVIRVLNHSMTLAKESDPAS